MLQLDAEASCIPGAGAQLLSAFPGFYTGMLTTMCYVTWWVCLVSTPPSPLNAKLAHSEANL